MPTLVYVAIILLCAFVLYVYLRNRRGDAAMSRARLRDRNGKYAAVSVHTYRGGCPEAEKIRGQRFLVNEAPLLPLAGCTWAKCNCRYSHHSDRRTGSGDRRRQAAAAEGAGRSFLGTDRRETFGRRASDWAAAGGAATAP